MFVYKLHHAPGQRRQRQQGDVREVIEGFLGNVLVVENLEAAMWLNSQGINVRCVTLNGELFELDGTISGGRKQGQVGIISRRSELEKIEDVEVRVGDAAAVVEGD
ncbi:hypothetical protein DC030_14995, partial [Enterococcus faecalis]